MAAEEKSQPHQLAAWLETAGRGMSIGDIGEHFAWTPTHTGDVTRRAFNYGLVGYVMGQNQRKGRAEVRLYFAAALCPAGAVRNPVREVRRQQPQPKPGRRKRTAKPRPTAPLLRATRRPAAASAAVAAAEVVCNVEPKICPASKDTRFAVSEVEPFFAAGRSMPDETWASRVYGGRR